MERLFDDIKDYLNKERKTNNHNEPVLKKFFLGRVFTAICNKLNEEADLAFRKRVVCVVTIGAIAMMSYSAYDTFRPRTFEQSIEMPNLSNEGKINILESFFKKDCVGARIDVTDCSRRKVWALEQLNIIRSQQSKFRR